MPKSNTKSNPKDSTSSQNLIPPKSTTLPPVLTIAGSDCSGGAGLQADLKTFSAHKLYGMSIVLSVVAENTARVISSYDLPPSAIDEQFEAVFSDIVPKASKIGMLGSEPILECVKENLVRYAPANVVLDPVMFAKNGYPLMPKPVREKLAHILPLCDVLTPNLPEASELVGFEITSLESMKKAAQILYDKGAKSVLIKGGHSKQNPQNSNDIFYNGSEFVLLESSRIDTKNTHGTGCTLSSAIACNLAQDKDTLSSVRLAKKYVYGAILHSLNLGKGNGPTNHFFGL